MLGTDIRWNWSWSEPFEGCKCQNLTKIHGRTEQTTKESGKIEKQKNHLWHLCTLLLSVINTNKTTKSQSHCGESEPGQEELLPANTAELVAIWEPTNKEPSPGNRNKVPPGPENQENAYLPASFTWRRPLLSISLWPASHNLSFAPGQTFSDKWLIYHVICLKRMNGFLCPRDPGKDQPCCLSTPCTVHSGHSLLQTTEEMWGPFIVF